MNTLILIITLFALGIVLVSFFGVAGSRRRRHTGCRATGSTDRADGATLATARQPDKHRGGHGCC